MTERELLFMCASSFQGGHSAVGGHLSDVLGVPFPISMPNLVKKAKAEGFNPATLWPWLVEMNPKLVASN